MPWSHGIARERRVAAREIFLEANRYLRIPNFRRASELYQQAIAIWPHPAFFYNLAIVQLNLVQSIPAWRSLQSALAYGAEPLGDEDKHAIALDYRASLAAQLGRVVIVCKEPDAEVTLDGQKVVFDGSRGEHEDVVMPGEHQVVARKAGRETHTGRFTVSAGKRVRHVVILLLPGEVVTERYLPAWLPWTGLAAGAVFLATGSYLGWTSSRDIDAFDEDFNSRCQAQVCKKEDSPALDSALLRNQTGTGFLIGGGILVATSAVLVYVNRERIVKSGPRAPSAALAPLVSPLGLGMAMTFHF